MPAKEMSCAASDDADDEAGVLLREEALGDRRRYRQPVAPTVASSTPSVSGWWRSTHVEAAVVAAEQPSKPRLERRDRARPWRRLVPVAAGSARTSSASASARRRPTPAIVIVTVTANSRNSRPTMPPISSSGMNTATSERLIDRMVKPISPAPLQRRLERRHARPRRGGTMFSSMTMASSTTKPTAMVSAISDRLSRL